MEHPTRWNYGWVYYLTAGIFYGAIALRSLLKYQGSPVSGQVIGLLSAVLSLFIAERYFSRKWPATFLLYLILQIALIITLLFMPYFPDYFALLFAILSMQIMRYHEPKWGVLWIVLFAPLMFVPLRTYGLSKAIPFTVVYTAVNAIGAAYSLAMRRAQQERSQTQALAVELQEASSQLRSYTDQLEQLAVSAERNRLARELHDSVTQTVFSMTLTTQSALMLLEGDTSQVASQLDRLYQLAQNAASEMQILISELRPEKLDKGGLTEELHRYLKEGNLPETLAIDLEVEGDQSLDTEEAKSLFRIIQEALNNIMKHAETDRAQIRLHLVEPVWIEIVDHGRGFDLGHTKNKQRVGLASMSERAQEIGWQLQIKTTPGEGTCVRVERNSPGERRA